MRWTTHNSSPLLIPAPIAFLCACIIVAKRWAWLLIEQWAKHRTLKYFVHRQNPYSCLSSLAYHVGLNAMKPNKNDYGNNNRHKIMFCWVSYCSGQPMAWCWKALYIVLFLLWLPRVRVLKAITLHSRNGIWESRSHHTKNGRSVSWG